MRIHNLLILLIAVFAPFAAVLPSEVDVLGCGGFVKSCVKLNFSKISVALLTPGGAEKFTCECAPNNGYYFIPIYDKGSYSLKVKHPEGWSFSPLEYPVVIDGSANDVCSNKKELDFVFKGFTIKGQVLSSGLKSGPKDVQLTLVAKNNDNILRSTKSADDGTYIFEEVLPGTYEVKALAKEFQFLGASVISVTVTDDNVYLNPAATNETLIVKGYAISGRVTSDGEPIKGVHFSLYTKGTLAGPPLENCNHKAVPLKKPVVDKSTYLCHVLSGPDGTFRFTGVPPGSYKVRPYYSGKNIQFEVKPDEVHIDLSHGSHVIPAAFQVEGFSVSGKVVAAKDGRGIPDAQVLLTNGRGSASEKMINTGPDGVFHLENIRTGTYTLQITANNVLFETTTVKISPASPQIPDIVAFAFQVCGRLVFTSTPVDLRISFTEVSGKENAQQTIETESDGNFCMFLKPGTYKIAPKIPAALAKEMFFVPREQSVTVEHAPILDLEFRQFSAQVSGKLHLIGDSAPRGGIKLRLEKKNNANVAKEWLFTGKDTSFTFTDVVPGAYSLRIDNGANPWCWDKAVADVNIMDSDISNLSFKQAGFTLTLIPSHPIKMALHYPGGKKTETLDIQKPDAAYTHCVSELGRYTIIPKSCHKFSEFDAEEKFYVDTSGSDKSLVLHLRARKHRVTASVVTSANVSDIVVNARVKPNDGSPETKQKLHLQKSITVQDNTGGYSQYPIVLWVKPHVTVYLEPSSSQLLFKPVNYEVKVGNDCVEDAVAFKGKAGLFISGKIQPKLEGVQITILEKKSNNVLFTTKTDALGTYVGGPFGCESDDGSELEIKAEKEGYLFKKLWTDGDVARLGHFEPQKLAGIIVKVVDADSEKVVPLKDVLISLSGGSDNFRQNSVTKENGQLVFLGLKPGQYFLRAVLKEFQFSPSSKIFDVKEGETVVVEVRGKRVTFSCFGVTNSLNGQPEPGVAIEAKGLPGLSSMGVNCSQLQEETVSESNGSFRLRDLQPDCEYVTRLKPNDEKNSHVSRSLPSEAVIKIPANGGDIKDVRLILFRKATQMDISGIINSKAEFWPTLKVKLFLENSPEQPVATIGLTSAFFSFPPIAIDNKRYFVKLESSLSTSLYDYHTSTLYFQANRSFEHFDLTFSPVARAHGGYGGDHDSLQGGTFYTLPLVLLATLLVYNYKKILPFLSNYLSALQAYLSQGRSQDHLEHNSASVGLKKKGKVRRT